MEVTKRDGRREQLDLQKFHKMVEEACEGLSGVSVSQVEMNSNIQFYSGITTKEIQRILVRSAADLISLDRPNYQYVAARLLLYGLYKEVYGQFGTLPLRQMIETNIGHGVYDKEVLGYYTDAEWAELNDYIKHERDFDFTYAGLQQLADKYLVQHRSTGTIYETPQIAFMVLSAVGFHKYPKETRLSYVKRFYDAISKHKLSEPTPIVAGVRTPSRQYASCVLVDVDDTLDSIFASASAVGKYTAARAGIGLNFSRIRAIKSQIRYGEVEHTGVVPFLKVFESTVRSTTQNGIRGGNASVYFSIWHKEIESILVLKNNKGTEDSRVRRLDYGIKISKLFYERLIRNEEITLFSPHEVPDLEAAYGLPEFDELYLKYEKSTKVSKTKVSATHLFSELIKERAETGRVYILNIDNANQYGPFLEQITLSNLCTEILLPTKPIQSLDDEEGRIATCILGAINLGKIKSLSELENLCDLQVRFLDELIDYQTYPVRAAEIYTKTYRTLGIGYTGFAHYLAKNNVRYEDDSALKLVHETTEAFAFYLTKASVQLAKEKGRADASDKSKYGQGLFPIDYYKKDIDSVSNFDLLCDWEGLRVDLKEHGIRNLTLMAQMPVESSSLITNSTNGIEPPINAKSIKKSKKGNLPMIIPGYNQLKNQYTYAWEQKLNKGYLNIVVTLQKFMDQTISANTYYNPKFYENGDIPVSEMLKDLLTFFKLGGRTLYYHNTFDDKKDAASELAAEFEKELAQQAIDDAELDDDDCAACKI